MVIPPARFEKATLAYLTPGEAAALLKQDSLGGIGHCRVPNPSIGSVSLTASRAPVL